MNDTTLTWIAAMYEAEGWFTTNKAYYETSARIVVGFATTDLDVAEAMCSHLSSALSHEGQEKPIAICCRQPTGIARKPLYLIYLRGRRAAVFMKMIRPLLFERRRTQVDRLLSIWDERPTASESQRKRRDTEARASQHGL